MFSPGMIFNSSSVLILNPALKSVAVSIQILLGGSIEIDKRQNKILVVNFVSFLLDLV